MVTLRVILDLVLPSQGIFHAATGITTAWQNDVGFQQLISEPTYILPSCGSCIDLIFTGHPNSVIHSGVHSSLHPNCHQILHCIFNFIVVYPPPYEWMLSLGL